MLQSHAPCACPSPAAHIDVSFVSGLAKVREFLKLEYPVYVVKAACGYMAASTGERAWLDVRDTNLK